MWGQEPTHIQCFDNAVANERLMDMFPSANGHCKPEKPIEANEIQKVMACWSLLAVFFGAQRRFSNWVPDVPAIVTELLTIRSHLPGTLISEIWTKPTTWRIWRWLDVECNLLRFLMVYWGLLGFIATLKRIETTIIVKLVVIYVFPFLGMTIVPNMSNFLGPTLSRIYNFFFQPQQA